MGALRRVGIGILCGAVASPIVALGLLPVLLVLGLGPSVAWFTVFVEFRRSLKPGNRWTQPSKVSVGTSSSGAEAYVADDGAGASRLLDDDESFERTRSVAEASSCSRGTAVENRSGNLETLGNK